MERIKSFSVDHNKLEKGIYISRKDGDVMTYDMRFCKPNCGVYLDNITMHTVEHMMATFLRNSRYSDEVVYFGPMGCQTGFYLLMRECVSTKDALALVKECLEKTVKHDGVVFGASAIECGNYRTLELGKAKRACSDYLDVLENVSDICDYEKM